LRAGVHASRANAHRPKESGDAQSDPVLIEKPASSVSYKIISGLE